MESAKAERSDQPLTPKEVAAIERCHENTVYRALLSGELQGYRVGKHWRITWRALRAYRERASW